MPKATKSKRKQDEPIVPMRLQHELGVFFARYSPRLTNLALRNILMDYLINGPEADMRVEKGLTVIWNLMRLLDKFQDILPPRSVIEVLSLSKKGDYYPEFFIDDKSEYEEEDPYEL